MAVLPVPAPLGLPNPVAPKVNYSYSPNGTGGVNYFANGKPITNAQFSAGTGQNTNTIESGVRSTYNANHPSAASSTGGSGSNTSAATDNNVYGGGNGSGGGSVAPATVYPDKSNDIAEQNAGLGSLDSTRDTGLSNVNSAYDRINGNYASERVAADTSHTNESHDNTTDLQSNKQTAMQDAVQGRRGLFGTLASLGALSGDGLTLANDAVRRGANEDLTTAGNTFATNQSGLDSSYNTWKAQDKSRQDSLDQAVVNQRAQVLNDYYKSQQSYYNNIANDYQDEGNTGQAKTYIDKASALFPQIASSNVPNLALNYAGGAYTAPTLSSYVGKANTTSVQSTPATSNSTFNIPGLVAANKKQGA